MTEPEDIVLTPADLEVVFDEDGKPTLLVPTAAGRRKLIVFGLNREEGSRAAAGRGAARRDAEREPMKPETPVLPKQPDTKPWETVFAEDQPEYLPLPAVRLGDGTVITRWKLTWRERLAVLFGGSIWLQQLTFNQALQPQLPMTKEPEIYLDSNLKAHSHQ